MTKLSKQLLFTSISAIVLLSVFTNASSQTDRERSARKAREAADQSAKAARVFDQIMATREKSIPQDLLDRAEAVAVFPGVIKAACAGLELKGVVIKPDNDDTTQVYGMTARDILTGANKIAMDKMPVGVRVFPQTLARYSRRR